MEIMVEISRYMSKLGVVMNKVSFDTHSSKKHYYKTYYLHYKSGYYEDTSKKR